MQAENSTKNDIFPYLVENMAKTVSIKVTQEAFGALKDQQETKRKKSGKKPNQEDVIDEWLSAWIADSKGNHAVMVVKGSAQAYPYARENKDLHDKLELLLNSPEKGTVTSVIHALMSSAVAVSQTKSFG